MKKLLACLFLAGAMGLSLAGAQNFADNQYQKAGREYETLSAKAMTAGEYEKAGELAGLAVEEYRKSREIRF